MKKNLITVVSLLAVIAVLVAFGTNVFAQTPSAPSDQAPQVEEKVTRTISVTGSGKASLTPDIAYVTLGVHTEGANASEAVSANNASAKKLIDAIKSFGIADKDIRTTNFSIYPQQQFDNQGKPTGEIKYLVDNSVYVTVRDLSKVGGLLDAAVKAGSNSISGIQFDVADKAKALSDARAAAVTDAQTQAEELAKAAGVSLGDVQTITTSTTPQPPVPMYDVRAAQAAPESVPVSPGEMIVSVDVNIVYAIK